MSRLAVITKCSPRLKVTMDWGRDIPVGATELYVKRAGSNLEFAAYPALEVNGGEVLFEFDDLLFVQTVGVFEGRLLVSGLERAVIRFWYTNSTRVRAVENSRC